MSPFATSVLVVITGGCALLGVLYAAMSATLQRLELLGFAVVFALLAVGGSLWLVGA